MTRLLGGVTTVLLAASFWDCGSPYAGNSAETENTIAEVVERTVSGLGEAHHGKLSVLADPRQAETARRT